MTSRADEILEREIRVLSLAAQIRFYPAVIEKAEGVYVYDINGRKLLDFNAAWAVANTGYAHPRIVKAVIEAYKQVTALSYTTFSHRLIVELAEKLVEITPGNFEKRVIFGHSGSDANDAIVKMVPYCTKKSRLITFIGAYHGQTMGSYSISGHKAQALMIGLPNVVKVPYPYGYRCPFPGVSEQKKCEEATISFLENYIMKTIAPPETISAIVVEPIQSDAGDIVPTPWFLRQLRRIADENGILLAVDEVKVGLGRTGKMFAVEHSGVKPDIVVLGKPLASGLPLSAVVMPAEIANCAGIYHLFTLAPQPATAAAALETIRIIIEEDLVGNAERIGEYLLSKLSKLREESSIVGDIRGKGLIVGIEIVKDKETKEPGSREAAKIVYRAWELGLVAAYTGLYSNVIELTPPLIIGKEHVDKAVEIISQAINDVEKGRVPDEIVRRYTGW